MLNSSILDALRDAVDGDSKGQPSGLITTPNQLQTYECDGLTNFRALPGAVVLPRNTAQVQAVIRICAKHAIPFVARGAGTGLSGGALPSEGGVVISFARMTRILEVDIPNQRVVVQPGVINAHVTDAVARRYGYFFMHLILHRKVCAPWRENEAARKTQAVHIASSTDSQQHTFSAWKSCCLMVR